MEKLKKMKKITKYHAGKAVCLLLVSGILIRIPAQNCEAAVITSNATDKVAVVFNEHTAYRAGDYVTYDGELYICTGDTQGTWNTAESDFMQITKNRELGKCGDLSADYDAAKDPSDETSLMAFAANAWQKLRAFWGTDNRSAELGTSDYKSASVSTKLNFLEEQNRILSDNLIKLQGDVNNSFQSVSNGKQNLADAITGEDGVKLSPSNTFQEFCDAIHSLAQAKKAKGREEGYREGYDNGRSDGIQYADSNVNKESESYKQGLKDSDMSEFYDEIILYYDGADKGDGFSYSDDGVWRSWTFCKQFAGHTIYAVNAYEYMRSSYGSHGRTLTAVRTSSGGYDVLTDSNVSTYAKLQVTADSITWGSFQMNGTYKDSESIILKLRVWYS